MQFFPQIKPGDTIDRKWFNSLIGFCNSLVLRGDGKTTRVNRGAGGTTVSAIIPSVTRGGGGGASDFSNFPVSINGGTVATATVEVGAGTYFVDGGAVTSAGASWSLPQLNPFTIYGLYDRDTNGYPKTSFIIGRISDPSFKSFPIANVAYTYHLGRITSVTIQNLCRNYPCITSHRMPWEVYIGNFTDGDILGVSATANFYMEPGAAPQRLDFPVEKVSWSGIAVGNIGSYNTKLLLYHLDALNYEFVVENTTLANNSHYAWYSSTKNAWIPIAELGSARINQVQFGTFYGITGHIPS